MGKGASRQWDGAAFVPDALPQNADAERSVLGSVLLEPKTMPVVISEIRGEDFFLDSHRKIYAAMLAISDRGQDVDLLLLTEELDKRGHLKAIGGAAYISSLTDGVPRRASIEHHVRMVREKSRSRRLIHTFNRGVHSLAASEEVDAVIGSIEQDVLDVLKAGNTRRCRSIREIAEAVYAKIVQQRKDPHGLLGYATGVDALDEITTGWRESEYVIIAGRTGHGKSSLMMQSALANAAKGVRVLVSSLEMTSEALLARAIATYQRIPHGKLREPRWLNESELQEVARAGLEIGSLPLVLDDASGLDIRELAARIRMHILRGVELVFVDYLQLIGCRDYRDKYDQVTAVSAALRDVAKLTGVPVVALSQLKRPEQGGEHKRPTLYDLKESGNIENDAFTVVLIHRAVNRETGEFNGEDELIVAKQRNGITGVVRVTYNGDFLSFRPRTARREPGT